MQEGLSPGSSRLMANDLNQKHQGHAQNLLFSTYFLNIDGNKTNFDRLSAELAVIKHKFAVVALAETNTDECNKDLYKLSNEYTPVYSSKMILASIFGMSSQAAIKTLKLSS